MSSTANPRHPNNPPSNPEHEPTGIIASDSLANESIKSGGGFSENPNPELTSAKGHQSTLANTDTSGADTLPAATSASARNDNPSSTKYPDAAAGKGFDGVTSPEGYVGGSKDASISGAGAGSSGHGSASVATGAGVRPQVDSAPGYVPDSEGAVENAGDMMPKGRNLTEGGDIPEGRDTYMGDVGGSKDPGRLAERQFQRSNADASAGLGAREYAKDGENQYDSLKSSERA